MTALLDKLKDLFSKSFVVSSYLPVFVCIALNLLLLYETNETFRDFIRDQQPKDSLSAVLQNASILVLVAVLAILISPSITFFREVLEGQHWLPVLDGVRGELIGYHTGKLEQCKRKLRELQHDTHRLESEPWLADLRKEAEIGKLTKKITYSRPTLASFDAAVAASDRGETIAYAALLAAKNEVATELAGADSGKCDELKRVHTDFINLFHYATSRNDAEIVRLINEQQRNWGATVAPTELGNRASATSSYGLRRYGFSMEIGWSRLQKVLQKENASLLALQDVKAGLDSAVTLFFLLAVTTFAWSVILVFQLSLVLFVTVTVGGALSCTLLYRTAISSYEAFSDLLRSYVDHYRFQLLEALHLPLPEGPGEEKRLWTRLRSQMEFAEESDLRYKHPRVAGE